MSICYLIGAGTFTVRGLYPAEGDFVIAADGGYTALRSAEIKPDLLVGDFDSLQWVPDDVPQKVFPPEKDDTDMAIALAEGITRGYRSFRFYGASGGRMDHTQANLQLLAGASRQGFDCKMVCSDCDVYAITNRSLCLPRQPQGGILSVLCHGSAARGVTLQGVKYPLRDALLTCERPLGVSNQTLGGDVSITVTDGTLLVYVMLQL